MEWKEQLELDWVHTENATQPMYSAAMWSLVMTSIAKGGKGNGPPEVLLLEASIVRVQPSDGKETII